MREELGFTVQRLPSDVRARIREGDREKYLIPDLVIIDRRAGERWAIDVTGLYGEADSYLPNDCKDVTAEELCGKSMDVLRAREKRKDVHYDALSSIGEVEVIPFAFESHGCLGERAEQFISDITGYAADQGYYTDDSAMLLAGYIRRRISIAIQRGNASLDARASSSQRNSYAARASLGEIDWFFGSAA
jgi:hypothetical protein